MAVLAVVFDHLFHWPAGGFVGVDVFFVLSGFLITGLLLREYERHGRISLTDFYRRRFRRIVPVAALVLAATVIVSNYAFLASKASSIFGDAIAALLFFANWRFASVGTDYFQSGTAPSPLQHYWSLSVEEQFYFVWPWLLIIALAFVAAIRGKGRVRNPRSVAAWVIGGIALASFGWAMFESVGNPTVAYFSTFSRAWELGIGALLACATPLLGRLPRLARTPLAYLGLLTIGLSLVFVNSELSFPAPWALLPVVGSALVVAAGTGGDARFLFPLTNPVAGYIGNVSYSIYLWHFPVIVLGAALFGGSGVAYFAGVLILVLMLSVTSYHLVEVPVQHSPLLERFPSRQGFTKAWASWVGKYALRYRFGGLAILGVASLAIFGAVFAPTPPPETTAIAVTQAPEVSPTDAVSLTPEVDKIEAGVQAALATTSWPELTPALDKLDATAKVPEWVTDGCLGEEQHSDDDPVENAERCVYGDPNGDKTLVLLGDSTAISWLPAIRSAVDGLGWKVLVYTMMQCPYASVTVILADGSDHVQCDPFRQWTQEQVAALHPQLVIAAQSPVAVDQLASRAEGDAAETELASGVQTAVSALAPNTDRLVVLENPPRTVALTDCATAVNSPADCAYKYYDAYKIVRPPIEAAGAGKATFLATKELFCAPTTGMCPVFVDSIVTTVDGSHMTGAYSAHLGPALRELLFPVVPTEAPTEPVATG